MWSTLFYFLAFAMVAIGVLGLVNPKWFTSKKTGEVPERKQLVMASAFLAGVCGIVSAITAPEPTAPASKPQSQKQSVAIAKPASDAANQIKPESIVEFPNGEMACLDHDDLQAVMLYGLSGRGTKMKAFFESQDGDEPRCLMLPAGKQYKVIDAEYNDAKQPDAAVLEIVGADIQAAEKGAFAVVLDKSMVRIVEGPPDPAQ